MPLRRGYKADIYPVATPLHAPRCHARAHARERGEGLDTPRTQHDTHTQPSCHSSNDRAPRYYTTKRPIQRNRDFCVLCTFVGVTAPCAQPPARSAGLYSFPPCYDGSSISPWRRRALVKCCRAGKIPGLQNIALVLSQRGGSRARLSGPPLYGYPPVARPHITSLC